MTLFVGGPWDGRDVPLTIEEQARPYVVMALAETDYLAEKPQTFTSTQTMYVPRRWVGHGGVRRTVFAPGWLQDDTAEMLVLAWLREHPGEELPR